MTDDVPARALAPELGMGFMNLLQTLLGTGITDRNNSRGSPGQRATGPTFGWPVCTGGTSTKTYHTPEHCNKQQGTDLSSK